MKPGYAILRDKKVFRVKTVEQWGKWMETANRVVSKTIIGNSAVSTVFIGIDHNFFRGREPQWFETMVFGGPLDGEMERYSTWTKAEEGHGRMVERVREIK